MNADTIVDGRYRIISRVGSGGMADVYCAEDLQLGRRVALKLLHGRFAEDAEFVERFRREASAAAGLQHQHVVSVYDRGDHEGTYYIAMEYLEGRSLKQLIVDEAPLPPTYAIDLVTQILRAARFAHKRGIIHRDLKPQNVIIDSEGRVKVTDFGIAKAGASDMTQTGSIMGTAQYLSPEQAQGLAVSAPSDLYSIGIILYEMLTGRLPFDGESAVTIALKQVNEHAVPPSQINPGVSPALESVVTRAMEKDPARRFADADEFVTALEHARAGLGTSTETGLTAVAPGAPMAAAAYAAGASPPTAVEPLLPPTGAYEEVVERRYSPAGPPPEDRSLRWWTALAAGLVVAAVVVGVLLLSGGNKLQVPDVVGAPQAEAEIALKREGLKPDVTLKESADRPKGEVIGQDPAAGAKVEDGSVVTLTVSAGPGEARVPDLQGQSRNEARKALSELGFEIEEERTFSDEIGENRVVESRPAAGTSLERGLPVTLVISRGKERIAVPKVVGTKEAEARTTLEDAGFKVTVKDKESTDQPAGTVLAQDPKAGGRAVNGSTVTITVAKEPERIDVPDVTGKPEGEAIEELSSAGFTVRTVPKEVKSPDDDGVVLEQAPAPGKAKKGSRVTITVGRFNPDLDPDPTPTTPTETTTTP